MITEIFGDILKEPPETLVAIPVNCVGVAGAGLAKQWATKYPDLNKHYIKICERGLLRPGGVHWLMSGEGNFLLVATKDHWKDPSRIEWIENILEDMADLLKSAEETMTIALPRIGAGLGGLPWDQVDNLIYYWLSDHEGGDRLDRHTILLYEPR